MPRCPKKHSHPAPSPSAPFCCCCPQVIAQAFDNPIPGFKTPTVGNLRLWDAVPVTEFDLAAFNAGDYDKVSGQSPGRGSCLSREWARDYLCLP